MKINDFRFSNLIDEAERKKRRETFKIAIIPDRKKMQTFFASVLRFIASKNKCFIDHFIKEK